MATRKKTESTAPLRIHELAKELGLSSKELRETIDGWKLGWDTSNHMKVLDSDQIAEARKRVAKPKAAPKKAKATKKAASKKTASKKAAPKKAEEPKKAKATKKAKAEEPKKAKIGRAHV